MKRLRNYWRHGPGRLSTRIVMLSLIITATLAFFLPLAFSQDKPTQPIQDLLKSPKIIFPEAARQKFMDGESTIRVIVNLKDPLAVSQAQIDSSDINQVETIRSQVVRNLKDSTVREKLKEDVKAIQDSVINALDAREVRITNRYTLIFGFSAEVTPKGLEALINNPDVLYIEEDRIVHAHLNQGIPLMNATTPRISYNGSGMAIAICDTGIDYTHPKLGNSSFPNTKVIGGYDTGQDDSDPMDGNGHGTACAGIAAGDLGSVGDYIGGVAYNAKLYALKMTYNATGGSAYTSDMVEAWEWCVIHQNDDPSNPIMIISTSFGGGRFYNQSSCDSASPSMANAAANAVSAGITLFVSTGNDGYCDSTGWPGCMSDVIGIGAVYDANIGRYPPLPYVGCIASGSCTGYSTNCPCLEKCYVDDPTAGDQVTSYSNSASFMGLFAPSNKAYTCDITGGSGYSSGDYYDSFGGTSAACPYAAGAAACLQSAAMAIKGAYLSPAEVESYLTNYGDSVTDQKVAITKPRINLGNAVNALESGAEDLTCTPVTPCRIVDTRKAGGAISPGGIRSYSVWGSVASQGGNPAGCPSSKGEPLAAVLNVTAVPLGNGWITAYPYGSTAPLASLVNYRSGAQNVANSGTVKTCFNCAKDISVKSGGGTTHVVIDVLGYYYAAP